MYYYLSLTVALLFSASILLSSGDSAAQLEPGGSNAPLVVAELFTSQGCSSCPPADRVLGELATDFSDRVLALSFHVDYWNYIGWEDPFSAPGFTQRQRDYARYFGRGTVYTPQLVINGRAEAPGSSRNAVFKAIGNAERTPADVMVTAENDHILLTANEAQKARIWLVEYDRRHETPIARGENGGRKLVNYNVVRRMRLLGTLDGKDAELTLPPREYEETAILVQREDGAIIGAARL